MEESLQKLLESIERDIDAAFAEGTTPAGAGKTLEEELFGESMTQAQADAIDINKEADAILGEATVMKLDAKAQLKKAISVAAINIAKEKAPQVYEKYKAAQAKKVALEELMVKKFRTEAIQKVKDAQKAGK